jgi:circadian clock protein KaiC
MRSINVNLEPYRRNGLRQLHASRPTLLGLEAHLVQIHKMVTDVRAERRDRGSDQQLHRERQRGRRSSDAAAPHRFPEGEADHGDVHALDLGAARPAEATDMACRRLIDTWLLVRDIEVGGERNRGLYVIKFARHGHTRIRFASS